MRVNTLLWSVLAGIMTLAGAQSAQAQIGPWTGLYIGANIGYGWTSGNTQDSDGFIGGLHGGYNWQFGSALAGLEADYSFAGLDGGSAVSPLGSVLDVESLWSIRARLGFLPTGNILLYGTVGYGGFETRAISALGTIVDDSQTGLAAGGGVEMTITRNVLARAETIWYLGNGGDGISDTDVGTLRLGLSYKF